MKWLMQASSADTCLAIGEAGLDKLVQTSFELQEEFFVQQAQLASALNKPMIIHCVKAYGEILNIRNQLKVKNIWIFHGYGSSLQMARQLIDQGCMLSFGSVLFKDEAKATQAFEKLKPEQYFLETDDTDYSIEDIYLQAAERAKLRLEELKNLQIMNFRRVLPGVQFSNH
jgi:TatD DNase family protein